jgi:hypothetical protein
MLLHPKRQSDSELQMQEKHERRELAENSQTLLNASTY